MLHGLFSQWHEDTSLHVHRKPSFQCLLITQAQDLPCCNFQCLCSALQLSATIQPSESQTLCQKLWWKNIVHSYQACFFFPWYNGAFVSSQALFSSRLGLSSIKFGRKSCNLVSAILHHIPTCPLHYSSTSITLAFDESHHKLWHQHTAVAK